MSQDALPQPYLVQKIILNQNYNSRSNDQDIALLRLTSPVVFDGTSRYHFILILMLLLSLSHQRLQSEFKSIASWKIELHPWREGSETGFNMIDSSLTI